MLLNANDYYNDIEKLFQDMLKLKQILKDQTPSRLTSVQRYLKQLNKGGELTNDMYDKVRPKSVKLARAHGLPEIHKVFENIPSFCPIIETSGTTHHPVAELVYLSELLNPLTHNDCSLKDSFDAAMIISRILPQVRENDEYMFISLDVVSLFTNMPLKKSVNIILKRIYNEKQITTPLSKRSLKKLNLDTRQKNRLFLSTIKCMNS